MDSIGDTVWQREGGDEISRSDFNALYMLFTLGGLCLTAVVAKATLLYQPNWLVLIGVFVVSIIGIVIALSSTHWFISLIGFALVAGPFGALVGPVVNLYTEASVLRVAFVTGGLVTGLGIIGYIYPRSLESWGAWLFGGLLLLIIGQFGLLFAKAAGFDIGTALTVTDWIGVALFSAYVIFDVNQAQRVPSTVDNAVDCALALYLDVINLFLRLLRLLGELKNAE